MVKPSRAQKSANKLYNFRNISELGANRIASSANNRHHSYMLSNYTRPEIDLPRVLLCNISSILASMRSKNNPNSSGLHGQPYFNPINILIRSVLVTLHPFTSALSPTYNNYNALTIWLSKPSSSVSTCHSCRLDTLSYAFYKSTNIENSFYLIFIARYTSVLRIKQLSSTLWYLLKPACTLALNYLSSASLVSKIFRQVAYSLENTCITDNPRKLLGSDTLPFLCSDVIASVLKSAGIPLRTTQLKKYAITSANSLLHDNAFSTSALMLHLPSALLFFSILIPNYTSSAINRSPSSLMQFSRNSTHSTPSGCKSF